jgi:hypothetical protein
MTTIQKPADDYFKGQRSDVANLVPPTCVRILDVGCGFGGLGRNLLAWGVTQVFARREIMDLFSTAGLQVELVGENRESLSLFRRIILAPLLFLVPDLGVCQYLIRVHSQ